MTEKCVAENCNRIARDNGLCAKHKWQADEGLASFTIEEQQHIQTGLGGDAHVTDKARQCLVDGCRKARQAKGLCTMHYSRKHRGVEGWDDPERWRQPAKPKPRVKPAAEPTCEVEGCDRKRAAKGLCGMHYSRKWKGIREWADPGPLKTGRKKSAPRFCELDGCDKHVAAHGLCSTHNWRKRQGDPRWDDPIPRPLPPKPEKPRKPGPVPPDVAAALAADWAIAKLVKPNTAQDSPAREVNRRFNASLVALAAAGHTYAQIAEAVGGSIAMVYLRFKRINASREVTAPQPENSALSVETCTNGHPRIAANLTTCSDGRTRCKVCRREAQGRRQARLRNNPELRPEITDDMHGGSTAYRNGCRCDDCRQFHSEQSQEYKWTRRFGPDAPMGPEVRSSVLDALRRTGNVAAAAAEVGVKHQAIYGAVKAVPGFGILVDKLTRAED